MIVKNEARSIAATIASVRPWVDRYTILDTGSTDRTRELLREAAEGLDGELLEAPFVDFSTTRNRALDHADPRSVFTLMLSGDETLHEGAALRDFCERHREDTEGAYHVDVRFGDLRYDSARLARCGGGWRYVGVTHEVLRKDGAGAPRQRVPGAYIHHELGHRDPEALRQRWLLDRRLLVEERKRRPEDPRALFYLAQTLECLDDHRSALGAYQQRVAMGGWREEVYEALFRIGRVLEAMGSPWPEVQQAWLVAHAHSPHRAEPLYRIAWHYFQQKNWPLTFLFAQRAAQLPEPPPGNLFVNMPVYRHKALDLVSASAYYVGERAAGLAALERLLTLFPDDPRHRKNLTFYEKP